MASKDIMMRLRAQDKSKNAFNSVNKSLNNTQQSMNKIKGAIAAAFSITVISNFAKETLALADNIGKTADSLNLSTTFLQKYQFAAEQSGLSQEEFNKSMMVFSKLVGQASIRTNEVGRTLDKLGIKLKDTQGNTRAVEDVFLDLMKKLDGVESSFEKNAILSDVFGRAGLKMSVMLAEGSQAMMDLAESATGIIPEKSIRDAERFNDTMNQLKRATLLPLQSVVIGTANAFLDLLDAIGLHTRSKTILQLEYDYEQLRLEIEELSPIVDRLATKFKEGDERLERHRQPLLALQEEYKQVGIKLDEAREKQEKYNRYVAENTVILEKNLTAKENIKTSLESSIPIVEQFANTVEGKLTAAFQSFFDFTNKEFLDFKNLAMSVAQAVINELIKVFIIEKLVSSIKSSITGIPDSINNTFDIAGGYEGGGYTGSGVRAGGLDGKGGFMAMLHPNETVIDHTKGQGMGGGAVVNFNISTVDAKGFDELLASRKNMITAMINQAYNSRGKMGII